MSPDERIRLARATAELVKRSEFAELANLIPEDVVSTETAHLVAREMAKVAARKLFPESETEAQ